MQNHLPLLSVMDLQACYPLLTTFLFLILAILTVRKRLQSSSSTLNLPPGPWKLPLIGNLHNMVGSIPHHALRALAAKYGPLMHMQLGEVSAIVVSSAKVAKEVMKTHDATFGSRPPVFAAKMLLYDSMDIIFTPYSEYWRQVRKISTLELLSKKRAQSFWWIREEEASNLVERIALNAGSPVNLTRNIYSLAYTFTARAAFGNKCRSREHLISMVAESAKHLAGFNIADMFPSLTWLHVISGLKPKLEKMHRKLDEMLDIIINEHRAARESDATGDLINVLLKFEESNENGFSLSIGNIKAVIMDVLIAGSQTTAMTVDWAMAEMMRRPKILEKAQAEVRRVFNGWGRVVEQDLLELKFLNSVVKETLRLHAPVPLILRECRERCKIDQFDIPATTKVLVNAWAIGRDPDCWTEPEKFDPERFLESPVDCKGNNFQYIPFGAGRRVCPGMTYGLVNVEFQLATLLYHFDWKLPDGMKNGEDLNMTESLGVTVGRKEDMYLIPTTYHPFQSTTEN